MKAQLKITVMLMIAGLGFSAAADSSVTKANTRIDFNRMIDDNNSARNELHKDIDVKANAAVAAQDEAERAKVVDFVDVEVGWGESAPVVDRRFDSVGEAKPYKMDESSLRSQSSGT